MQVILTAKEIILLQLLKGKGKGLSVVVLGGGGIAASGADRRAVDWKGQHSGQWSVKYII
jgi:hypothetical protein